ncbi:MAG: Gfo/Idh/MocA family oxidoreductase [Pontiellaceae bacterium]|nr:Gfo/Idh/MocA family oxidoreductase [Pontiellaceae bacterium]
MKSLVIGYGSIGARHEAVLREMGAQTAVVSRHAVDLACPFFSSVEEALAKFEPQYVVVANRTSEHLATLRELKQHGFTGICLVEKPLFNVSVPRDIVYGFKIMVGYVLRFHPLLRKANGLLEGKRIISIHAYVGQYLPDWRPGTDYQQCYSAKKSQGGGVLRDLSHELDYIGMLAGCWKRVSALGGHFSGLEIETDDVFGLLMETERCPVALCQMNYLDRNVRRDCTIQYEGGTLFLDFVGNRLVHNGDGDAVSLERNEMFAAMHAAAWSPEAGSLCSLEEGIETVELIDAAEIAAKEGCWICRTSR